MITIVHEPDNGSQPFVVYWIKGKNASGGPCSAPTI